MGADAAALVPTFLLVRLNRAEGHINAADRKLWCETSRALWSGRQALARLAECWLWLSGVLVALEPVENYLSSAVLAERLLLLAEADKPDELVARLDALSLALAEIEATPFDVSAHSDRETLYAGLGRQSSYVRALRGVMTWVEDALFDRYLNIALGSWLRNRTEFGVLVARKGLFGLVFVPRGRRYQMALVSLAGDLVQVVDRPSGAPLGCAGYYWMVTTWGLYHEARKMGSADWCLPDELLRKISHVLYEAARSWWVTFSTDLFNQSWEPVSDHFYSVQPRWVGELPEVLHIPWQAVNEALSACDGAAVSRRPASDWREQAQAIMVQLEAMLCWLEQQIAPMVDVFVGDWVAVPGRGVGVVVQRLAQHVVVDLGRQGVVRCRVFRDWFERVEAPITFELSAFPEQHRRWLWFAMHDEACLGRACCACCGYAGVTAEWGGCGLCGWSVDAAGSLLDDGRLRFDALGYAEVPSHVSPEWMMAWVDPRVVAWRAALLDVMAGLMREEGALAAQLSVVALNWEAYHAALDDVVGELAEGVGNG